MAISTELLAQELTPAYNRVEYWFDSTNKNEDGFRYVFDVYEAGTSNKIGEYRAIPRYDDGFGVIDLSRLLRNYVSPDYDFTSTFYNASNSVYAYDLKVGEEYAVEYAYTGFTNSSGYVQLTGFSSHVFVVGNQINLTESVAGTNPLLTGLHVVTAVTATTVTIDVLYADLISPSSIAGYIVFADGRKTITRDIVTVSSKFVFNGALSWREFNQYSDDIFDFNAGLYRFLTNIPDNFSITEDQDLIFNLWHQEDASTTYVKFVNSNGDVLYKDVTQTDEVKAVAVGANNAGTLLVSSGSLPLIKSDTEYYDVSIADVSLTSISETKRIYIDRRCAIEDYSILFLDRLGSWGSFSFNLKADLNGSVTRDSYRKHIDGEVIASKLSYDTYAAGLTNINIEAEETLTLRTNWMSQADNEYFKELVTSPVTLLKVGSDYYSVNVQDTSYEVVQQRGKKVFNKTIKVKFSNNDIING